MRKTNAVIIVLGVAIFVVGMLLINIQVVPKCTLGDILQFMGGVCSLIGAIITGNQVVSIKKGKK